MDTWLDNPNLYLDSFVDGWIKEWTDGWIERSMLREGMLYLLIDW